jgi:hypothetical protein
VAFKLEVVACALKLPAHSRIKPTCRAYPGVEPVSPPTPPSRARPLAHYPFTLFVTDPPPPLCCPGLQVQVRKWIRNLNALQRALPGCKMLQKSRASSPDLMTDENSDTESTRSALSHEEGNEALTVAPRSRPRMVLAGRRPPLPSSSGKGLYGSRREPPMPGTPATPAWIEEMRAARLLLSLGA